METAMKEEALTIREKLDGLYGLKVLRYEKTKDLDAQIAQLEQEKRNRVELIDGQIQRIENEIKEECVDIGESVQGNYLQVLYRKGAELIDVDALKNTHPEICEDFKKLGKSSARITEIK